MISPVVVANWFVERQADGSEWLQLLVLWRGSVGWFLRPGESSVSGGGLGGRSQTTMTYAGLRFTLDFDSAKRIAIVQGNTIELAEDNVVFVDDADSATGPRVTRRMRVEQIRPWSAPQIGLVLRASPEILSFLRCDATLPGSPWQGFLEQLCLQNIGVVK